MMTLQCLAHKVCELEKAQGGNTVLSSSPSSNVLFLPSAVVEGETFTIGDKVFEADSDGVVATGNIPVTSTGGAYASTNLATSGVASADGNTVTIGARVYRLKTVMTQANDVQLGTPQATVANLLAAINGTGTAANYFAGTAPHAQVSAVTIDANSFRVNARTKGLAGNSIATTSTAAPITFTGATLSGGLDTQAAAFNTGLTSAINSAGPYVSAQSLSGAIVVKDNQERLLTVAETSAGAGNQWSGAAFVAGTNPAVPGAIMVARVPTAQEVTANSMWFPLNFAPLAANVTVRSSAGVYKAWDGAITISGNTVIVASSGAVKVAAGDIVTITAQ